VHLVKSGGESCHFSTVYLQRTVQQWRTKVKRTSGQSNLTKAALNDPADTACGVHCTHRRRFKPRNRQTDRLADRQTDTANIGNNGLYLMHLMQPKRMFVPFKSQTKFRLTNKRNYTFSNVICRLANLPFATSTCLKIFLYINLYSPNMR